MAVFFSYFVKSDLSSVCYCTRVHKSNFFQGTINHGHVHLVTLYCVGWAYFMKLNRWSETKKLVEDEGLEDDNSEANLTSIKSDLQTEAMKKVRHLLGYRNVGFILNWIHFLKSKNNNTQKEKKTLRESSNP